MPAGHMVGGISSAIALDVRPWPPGPHATPSRL